MATQDDVRRIAFSLPATSEESDGFRFRVEGKGFAWVWLERASPDAARVPNPDVLAVRVANEGEKDALLALDEDVFFTEPHYNGFPAVLVRLPAIDLDLLREVLVAAWRCQAPKRLIRAFEEAAPDGSSRRGG
jgi:hypothetical protein